MADGDRFEGAKFKFYSTFIIQDSGYDGYCPADKSITSIGSSSTASSTEDASTSANSLDAAAESHYGNAASYNRLAAKDIYGRIGAMSKGVGSGGSGGSGRPTSVYEKHLGGPVHQVLESFGRSKAQISQARDLIYKMLLLFPQLAGF